MTNNTIHAFTTQYGGLSNKLINSATLISNGQEYKTDFAQWDTGATNTCISKKIVKHLGLIPVGKTNIQTPSGQKEVNEYRVDIKLQNENVCITDVFVIDSEIGDQGIDILIGMNIIILGDFSVSNYDEKTVFSFRLPSQGRIDYVGLINNSIPISRGGKKTQPNDPCPCGSGKKYKRCCGKK